MLNLRSDPTFEKINFPSRRPLSFELSSGKNLNVVLIDVLDNSRVTLKSLAIPLYDIKIKPVHLREIQLLVKKLIQRRGMTDEDKIWFSGRLSREGEQGYGKG